VAAVTTVLFQRLRLPVVLGYVLAGLLVGPHLATSLPADRAVVETLSELGMVLLMFSLGLEFSVRRLAAVGPTAGLAALIQSSLMLWLGSLLGRLLGWTSMESLFAGAIVAISSTTIIAKAFDELRVGGKLRELVVGILIVEDLVGILLMAILTAAASAGGLSADKLAGTVGRLALFLGLLVAGGFLLVPRAFRAVARLQRAETLLIASLALCFGIALLAVLAGYSAALGAFIAGSLVAESGEQHRVEKLVEPVRDTFAAIFFVSVGMLIDPGLVVRHAAAVSAFTALVLAGKITGVALGAFVAGSGVRTAVQAGMSLAQIGEFSFIIAGLGLTLGATRPFLYPVAVAVSALTTLTTPWLIRASGAAASFVDRKLPRRLQTVAALYGSWLEQARTSARGRSAGAKVRRLARALLIDASLLAALVIGASVWLDRAAGLLAARVGGGEAVARWAALGLVAIAAVPLLFGLVRNARRVGNSLADGVLPAAAPDRPDLARAPRRALVAAVQLATLVLVALPVLAVTQPFVPGAQAAAALAAGAAVLGIAFWRSAAELQGHVRAGAQAVAESLGRWAGSHVHDRAGALGDAAALLPGLGEPVALRLPERSAALGRSLAALDLRGATGATVLAISRPGGVVLVPGAGEILRPGDVLALAGTNEAVAAARQLLSEEPAEQPRDVT
jgi:CPA2 family monovalent cation:H+ antiporter-2